MNTSLIVKLAKNLHEARYDLALNLGGESYIAAMEAHEASVKAVAAALESETPEFDGGRFMRACGLATE